MTPSEAAHVGDVLNRYGITLVMADNALYSLTTNDPRDTVSPGFTFKVDWGPRDCGLNFERYAVCVPGPSATLENIGAEDMLHEAMHLVMARKAQDVEAELECAGLLQLEWAVARTLSASIQDVVLDYQANTAVPDPNQPSHKQKVVGDWLRPRRSRWWLEGVRELQRVGLLDAQGGPTFKRMKEVPNEAVLP